MAQDDLSGTCRLSRAIFVVVMQMAVVFVVWNSLMAVIVGPEPKDDNWKTSKVQRREVAAAAVMTEAMLRMK